MASCIDCVCVCLCRRIESLQQKRDKLYSNTNCVIEMTRILDSLLSAETDAEPSPAESQAYYETLTGNSCTVSLSAASAGSQLRSNDGLDALPLPVQNVNLEVMDVNDMSVNVAAVSQCDVPTCRALSFTAVTTPGLVFDKSSESCAEVVRMSANHQQVPFSVVTSGLKLPTVCTASHKSLASVPLNGLVVPITADNRAVKTSTAQTHRSAPGTRATSRKSVLIAHGTSDATDTRRTAPVGQFVHLTIPTVLNLSGSNIEIRQFVSVPPRTMSSSVAVSLCSATGPQAAVSVRCSDVTVTATAEDSSPFVDSSVEKSSAPFQQRFNQMSVELRGRAVAHGHVTSDALSLPKLVPCTPVSCPGGATEIPTNCSTPPASHCEDACLDAAMHDTDSEEMTFPHHRVIPNIPTPDPSCSSQE